MTSCLLDLVSCYGRPIFKDIRPREPEQPKSYAAGVPFVIVNGVVVIDRGQHTGPKPGRALRGPGSSRLSRLTEFWTA